MRALYFEDGQMSIVEHGSFDLPEMQRLLQGWIELPMQWGPLGLYCNEEGRLRGMLPNVAVLDIAGVIMGPCLVVAHDGEGDARDMSPVELEAVALVQPAVEAPPGIKLIPFLVVRL